MKRFAYTQPNDGSEHAGKFRIVTPAYGQPGNTQGVDESDDDFLRRIIALRVPIGTAYTIIDDQVDPNFTNWVADRKQVTADIINRTDLSTGPGLFRDAWTIVNGKLDCDMPKAHIIHMRRVRAARDAELAKLDVPYTKALEARDALEQDRLAGLKQVLRDIPQTFDLSGYTTPETLKAAWPSELTKRG